MRHGSLFSGIGGFDLAAEWMGWENTFHCEWNPFGQKILKYYWPNVTSHEDITKTDFTIYRGRVDILSGGFPCQPYSMAGKRKGKDDERHLWPEMLRAIREIKPRWVVGENVRGLVSWDEGLVFEEVQTDLETQGYQVQPYILPAAGVQAPHRRDRVWFVAYSDHEGRGSKFGEIQSENGEVSQRNNYAESSNTGIQWNATNSKSGGSGEQQSKNSGGEDRRLNNDGKAEYVTNSYYSGLEGGQNIGGIGKIGEEPNKQLTGCIRSIWQTFPTVSPICNGNDGISERLDYITFPKWRNESIKAGGNAVVPQVVYQIFQAIQQYEDQYVNKL